MAYFMSDMAAGSTAALQMQRNMAEIPYVDQHAQVAAEQEKANLERTKLSNLITDSSLAMDKQKKDAISALTKSAGWGEKTPTEQTTAIAESLMSFDPEGATKVLSLGAAYEYKDALARGKKLEEGRDLLANTASTLQNIPEDKVGQVFDNLPQTQKQLVLDRVGKENWEGMDNKTKRAVVSDLFLSASGKLKDAAMDNQKALEKMREESRKELERMREQHRLQMRVLALEGKSTSGSGKDDGVRDWKTIMGEIDRLHRDPATVARAKRLDEEVDAAEAAASKGAMFSYTPEEGQLGEGRDFYSRKAYDAWKKAVEKRNAFELEQLNEERGLVASLPSEAKGAREKLLSKIDKQIASYSAPTPAEAKKPTPSTAPTAPSKDVPSNTPKPAITPEAFDAQWAKLKPGKKLVGPDGIEYTKK
jgi:hypothetical protein